MKTVLADVQVGCMKVIWLQIYWTELEECIESNSCLYMCFLDSKLQYNIVIVYLLNDFVLWL